MRYIGVVLFFPEAPKESVTRKLFVDPIRCPFGVDQIAQRVAQRMRGAALKADYVDTYNALKPIGTDQELILFNPCNIKFDPPWLR